MAEPTKAQGKALSGIKDLAGPDGWATCWPCTTKMVETLHAAGWLEKSVKPVVGRSGIALPFVAYRLTEAGKRLLGGD